VVSGALLEDWWRGALGFEGSLMTKFLLRSGAVAALFALAAPAWAVDLTEETEHGAIRVATFAAGLQRPWGLALLPEGGMLVTERPGRVRFVSDEGAVSEPMKGVPAVQTGEQCGLLDIALDPNFATNRLVYLSYCEPDGQGLNSNAAARGRLSDDHSELLDVEVIFSGKPKVAPVQNNGSRLLFDGNGHLFITTGDKYEHAIREQAQRLDSHIGKVIRINPDGTAPADNPFVGRDGALPEIWSYGHRNPQGLAFEPESGRLYEVEHGPFGGDELNLVEPGKNYGWPMVSFGDNYEGTPVGAGEEHAQGVTDPANQWTPSIAPSGLMFYQGDAFPEWKGDLFVGGLGSQTLVRMELKDGKVAHEERLLLPVESRIRHVVEAPDGSLFVLTDDEEGEILRLTPAGNGAATP
jgi:glucose/arabinose dehydrogenase